MTKRFLFLTVPKSGSNFLGSIIAQRPDIIFLNTVFSKGFFATHFNMHNPGPKSKTGVLTELMNMMLSDEKIVNELIRLRTERAPMWLLSLMQMDPGGYYGAKIHPYLDIWTKVNGEVQFALDPKLITDFFAPKYHWKIFTMSRKNYYDQMASSLLSMKAEYFGPDDLPEKPELFTTGKLTNEDIDNYREILGVYKQCYGYVEMLRQKGTTHIWYEDLIERKFPQDFFDYFEIRKLPVVPGEKLFNRQYSEAFEDYEYFKKTIDEL